MGLLKMFKSSGSKGNAAASSSGSTSLPPTPLYPSAPSAPSRSADRRRDRAGQLTVGAVPYEAMEQGRIPRAGPSARSVSSAPAPSGSLLPMPVQSAGPGSAGGRSAKSSAQSSVSGRYEDPPESVYRASHLAPPPGERIRQRASSELGPGKRLDRTSFVLHEDLERDYIASLAMLNSSPPRLEVGLPGLSADQASVRSARPPSPPRHQRPPPLIDPASFRQNSSDTIPSNRSRSPQPSLAASDRQGSSGRSAKEDKPKRGMFGIKAFGGRAEKASADSRLNRQLPDIPVRRDSREQARSPERVARNLQEELPPPPAIHGAFDPGRRNSGPATHARQASDGDLPLPPPMLGLTSHSAPVSPRDGPSSRLPEMQPFPSRSFQPATPDLPTPTPSSMRSSSNNGFPWLNNASRSRSKSPGPSRAVSSTGLDTLATGSNGESLVESPVSTTASSGILGGMPSFGKVRSRSRDMTSFATLGRKADDKGKTRLEGVSSPPTVIVPLPDAENDPSFQLRSFRHVSSGSGMDPGPEISYVPAAKPASTSRPGLSRPGSAMSMYDDSTDRKISVQKFRHSRRFSTNSATDLQLQPAAKIEPDVADANEILLSPTETVSFADQQREPSGVEMLVSPVKTRPATVVAPGQSMTRSLSDVSLKDNASEATHREPARNAGFIVHSRKTSHSSTSGPISPSSELTRRPTVNKNRRPTLSLSPEQRRNQTETWHVSQVASPQLETPRHIVSQPSSPRAATLPRDRMFDDHDEDRSDGANSTIRATSPMRAISPADSMASSQRQRLPLHARLASVTLSTGPSSIPDPACEIPPVKSPVTSPVTQSSAASSTQRASKSPSVGPVKPPYQRSVSTAGQSKSGTAKTTWDLSSSDEDSDEISAADAQRLRRNFSKVRTSSMPSGLRRPPSTAEAFGSAGLPPVAPIKAKSVSTNGLSQIAAPPLPRLVPVPPPAKSYQPGRPKSQASGSKLAKPVATSSESQASQSSSEDEALSKVAQRKGSNLSLAAAARKAPPPLSLPPMPQGGSRKKVSSEEEASTSPTSSTRTTTPGKMTPLRSASGPIVRSVQPPPKLSMGPPLQPYVSAVSPIMGPPIRPFGYATAGRVPRESPSSSQSGTGDTSSSGAPLTPRDGSSGSDIGVVSSNATESGRNEGGKSIHDRGGRGRRVSFMDNDWSATAAADAEAERKRKGRRREEAKQAIELGNAFNGSGERPSVDDTAPFNPYLGQRQASQPNLGVHFQQMPPMPQMPQMDPQQMMQMQMQMQMNPAYMQMHQYAMMLAKQQYQASVAAAALQAANEEWERSSNMTGFGGSTTGFPMPQNAGMFGMPSFPGMMPGFPAGPSSVYGGGSPGSVAGGYGAGPSQNWGTSSVYGESFGPPSMPRSSSAPKLQQYLTTPASQARQGPAVAQQGKRRERLPSASVSLSTGQSLPKSSKSPERPRRMQHSDSRPNIASPLAKWMRREQAVRHRRLGGDIDCAGRLCGNACEFNDLSSAL